MRVRVRVRVGVRVRVRVRHTRLRLGEVGVRRRRLRLAPRDAPRLGAGVGLAVGGERLDLMPEHLAPSAHQTPLPLRQLHHLDLDLELAARRLGGAAGDQEAVRRAWLGLG